MTQNNVDESKFSKTELHPPDWLNNKELFKKIIEKSEGETGIEILDLKSTPGSLKNDHYGSLMFRFAVKYRQGGVEKTKLTIVKTMPELTGHQKELLSDSFIYETEIGIYGEVIPRMESMLRAIGDKTVFAPKCLYHSLSPKKFLVFEDIVPLGYDVLRDRETTMDEVKMALTKLAKFHATSYKIIQEDPEFLKNYCHGLFKMKSFVNEPFVTKGCDRFITMLETQPDLVKYKPFIEALKSKIIQKCIDTQEEYEKNRKPNALYVLCHGDFHLRNMMMKHEKSSGRLEDILFLDFQLTFVGPQINDVLYSTFALLGSKTRLQHRDELTFYYFQIFQDTLRKLKFTGAIPKMVDFIKQIMDHKHFEIFFFIAFLPIFRKVFGSDGDMEKIMTDESSRVDACQNEEYVAEVRKMLPKYLHMGYLEE